ncbi:MAG: hypothetical protein GC179_16975 [Anaerolineaceae bacterium]|nr:hypothetical protein [Anaerolineaceae bacterium]
MNSEIDRILHQSHDSFTDKPQWLVIATIHGDYVGHLVQADTSIELDRVIALVAAGAGHHERYADEYNLGTLRFGLTYANKGFVVTAFTGHKWVLCLKFTEANLTVLMNALQVLPKVVDDLAQLEQKTF